MRRALVIGLGESGLAMARWLAREGWALAVADTRSAPPMQARLQELLPGTALYGAPLAEVPLEGIELVALSPGLAPRGPELQPLLAAAQARGIDCAGEIELFARALATLRAQRGYAPQVLGVTGTNGKTTTVRMLGAMLARAGRRVCVAGNVSPSALDALREALDGEARSPLPEAWVLELSSFQLAGTRSLACTAAAVLNVTQDHLDWHPDMADYAASKERIFAADTVRVLERDDPWTRAMAARAGAARCLQFGRGAPDQPGQYGLVRDAGLTWLACTDEGEAPRRKRRAPRGAGEGAPAPAPEAEPLHVHRLMPLEALPVRGTHNALNALAALALARAAGVALAPALRALQEFRAEPHRTEPVARIGSVEYIDDSKGTNVGATVAALRGLDDAPGGQRRIVVILGGDGKGQSFESLAEAVRGHARAAVLIGRDAPRIEAALRDTGVPLQHAPDLPAAVRQAAALAQPGDCVLLSPACASLDMVRNYAHRAEVFVTAVRELAAAAAPGAGS